LSPTKPSRPAIAVACVLGVHCFGSALAAQRPSGKSAPHRSLRSTTTGGLPAPNDISPLRMRVELPDGVLVVFDAAAPPEVDEGCLGYMGYWLSLPDKSQYVFGTTLYDEGDLTALLLALERDLGVDLEALADTDDRLDQALNAITEVPTDEIVWEPATVLRAVEIMGFDAKKELTRLDGPSDGGIAYLNPCGPDSCTAGVGPPRNCGSPEGLAREA